MKNFFQKISMKIRAMDGLTKAVFILFLVLALTTSVVAFSMVRDLTSTMTILNLPGAPLINALTGQGPQSPSTAGVALPEPWDGKSRVTVLLMGLDYRDWQSGDTPHSDTMILLSIDPVTNTASMLSVPRDLWVSIPGFDYGRINEAYFNGAAFNLPGGGPELARQTVEQFIGVPVQYYAVIEFNAFIKFIDELGGVQIRPDQPVTIEKLGGGQRQVLEAGKSYTLDGELALAYARERKTQGGDIDRARRQQEVILSIRNRILKFQNLPELIAKAPALYQDLSSGIYTNLNLQQAIQLGMLGLQLDTSQIKKGIIDYNMVIPTKSPEGEAILKPIPDKIRVLRDELFATAGSKSPLATPAVGSTLVRDEAARVVIWDGTGAGLGERTAEYLRGQGINVIQVADAGGYNPGTKIEIFNGKPNTVAYLAQLMGVASANIWNTYDPAAGLDVRVTIGRDWAQNNPLP
ncbi:MAG: LytR family transcriptional regulator [Chloroflexi bacterium]|nr:LytR family transcriptional regulator [Chloroflexota bacterium]